MRRHSSILNRALRFIIGLGVLASCQHAYAQTCCAGSSALTPGRLTIHEDSLVGFQARAADVFGSFNTEGHYTVAPSGASELDFEQDLFGALRFAKRGQAALLMPFVETRRQLGGATEFGGGIGDINLSGRYDFTLAQEQRYIPGIALLAGITLPTGRPVDQARTPLATGATGAGTFQGTVGIAVEQAYGHWLLNLTGLLAARTTRSVQGIRETLGLQFTGLAAAAYAFGNDAGIALLASYAVEGSATINGAEDPATARRVLQVALAGVYPLTDRWRLQGSMFFNPPLSGFGRNQPSLAGTSLAVVRSWL